MLAAVAVVLVAIAWWAVRGAGFTVAIHADRNVLLVTIDTLRADALGSYGGRAATPNLDRLASRGARFDFAHGHSVVTLPSHTSILTGHYPYEHGIRDNTGYRVAANAQTMATRLKAMGFATGAFVGGFPLDHRFGLNIGFDQYDDRLGRLTGTGGEAGERERRADAVVAAANAWIEQQRGKWFTWVHVYDPHVTYSAPQEFAARYPTDPYLAEVSWTDFALAALFDRLSSEPRKTLVIVTADHGEMLGEHGELTHSVFAYEPVLRVPLIVAEYEPGSGLRSTRGRTITAPARHVDILPTVLQAVGAPAPGDTLPGASLVDVIAGDNGADRPSYFEAMTSTLVRGWAPLRGVIVGREKYINLPIVELYDLTADPKEARNLAAVQPERVEILFNTLRTFDLSPPGQPQQETTETIERLRSLGYIGGGSAAARETYTEEDDPKKLIELEQMMTKAAEAFRLGRADEAEKLYATVIAKRADTEDAYRKLALVYWRTGRPGRAIATLETALKNGIMQREVRIRLGQYLAESGQAAKAIELLKSFADNDPDALIGLGNAYQMAGKRAEALATFNRLLTLDPDNALAHENIGVLHMEAKNYLEAETSLRNAIRIDPDLAGAYKNLGVLLVNTGRAAEAIDTWKRAVEIEPAELDALYNLTISLARAGRPDEARTFGERYVAIAPPAMAQDIAVIRQLLAAIR
ncbi:MAG TPA: sulfatase-like hydrolase/transferase [Vicinamibacterales bacterium]|nr:sulfatase-like hydrolase/transferase [Vicinamibacterales bacterium]